MSAASVRDVLRAPPGESFLVDAVETGATPGVKSRAAAERQMHERLAKLENLQERLHAEGTRSVLLVLQGMDTSGKDGTVRHVFMGLNPAGITMTGFKVPTPQERRHHFLWRIRRALPEPGLLGIFNRSHYEDVLVVRVHELVPREEWEGRFAEINRFEARVAAAGTAIVKCFLHISFDEQRERLLARLDDPTKRWKFKERDVDERELWPEYMKAYRDAVERCSTGVAPWYVVPSDHKWYRNWAIGQMLLETLEEMDPAYPEPPLDIPRLERRLAPPN